MRRSSSKSSRHRVRKPKHMNQNLEMSLRKIGKVAAVCACLFITYMVIAKASRPYIISHGESVEIAKLEEQMKSARTDNKDLKREVRFLQTARGQEIEARKQGFVKPGEVSVVVERPEDKKAAQAAAPTTETKKSVWNNAGKGIRKALGLPAVPRQIPGAVD